MTQKEQIKKIIYILELMTKRLKKIEESVLKKESKKGWKYEPNEDGFMGSENRIEDE